MALPVLVTPVAPATEQNEPEVAGAVVAGLVVVAAVTTAALVGRAGEVTLALANLGICGLGDEVSGFAIAPTAPRLRTPPATTPILTLPPSAFHCPARRVVSLVVGIRYGRRGWCGQFMLGGCDMGLLRGGALGNISR